jgi:hypothetical protein
MASALTDEQRTRRIRLLLALLCVPLLISGITLSSRSAPNGEVITREALRNVKEASIVEVRDHQGRAVLIGEFRAHRDPLGNTEFDAALFDRKGSRVIGEVELDIPPPRRADRRAELELDIIGLAPRENFTVVIDDREVATFATDDRGSVDRELQEGETVAPEP